MGNLHFNQMVWQSFITTQSKLSWYCSLHKVPEDHNAFVYHTAVINCPHMFFMIYASSWFFFMSSTILFVIRKTDWMLMSVGMKTSIWRIYFCNRALSLESTRTQPVFQTILHFSRTSLMPMIFGERKSYAELKSLGSPKLYVECRSPKALTTAITQVHIII